MSCAPRAQQLEPGLVADLDAAAGEQRHAAAQVGQLRALGEVELRARRAQLVVEVMDHRVLLLADVAVLRLHRLPRRHLVLASAWTIVRLESARRKHVRRIDDRLPSQRPDARLVQDAVVAPRRRRPSLARGRLRHPPACGGIGSVDLRERPVEPLARLGGSASSRRRFAAIDSSSSVSARSCSLSEGSSGVVPGGGIWDTA